MEEKVLIKRNGTEYYRKKREVKFERSVSFRYSTDKIEKLKEIAEENNTKYQTLIKDILDEYLREENKYDRTK